MGSAEILKKQTDNWLRVSGVYMLTAATVRLHTRMTNTSPRPKLDFDCVVYISTESQMLEGERKDPNFPGTPPAERVGLSAQV